MDSKRNTISKETLIGNGSRVRVRYLPYKYQGGTKITPILKEVMVVNLVKYEPTLGEVERKGSYLTETEGYTVDQSI